MNADFPTWFSSVVQLAGLGQLAIVAGSLGIPRILAWKDDVAKLRPLTRQVFWTYAGYIWFTNLSFGLISVLSPESLISGSFLAGAITAFIALYWAVRIIIQFTYFDRTDAPSGFIFKIAEVALVTSFIFFTATYGYAAVMTFRGIA